MKSKKMYVLLAKNIDHNYEGVIERNTREDLEYFINHSESFCALSEIIEIKLPLLNNTKEKEMSLNIINEKLSELNGQVYALEQQRKELLALESK